MLDTGEPLQTTETGTDKPAEDTSSQNPSMATEFALLRDVRMPLNPHSLPNFRLEGNKVVINITTSGSAGSPEYKSAIENLQARGCTVTIDRERSINFTHIEITADKSLFSPEAIAALEAKQNAERIMCEQATRAGAAIRASFMPDWGC